jgi:GNAT superfamily N-acetyltransferase
MNKPVIMVRDDLDNIPEFNLPAGYTFHWYEPGDEACWLDIQAQADLYNKITPKLFCDQFGSDSRLIHERMVFILDPQNHPIGTAAAWFNPDYNGQPCGRVHWVAIIPSQQGLGLSKSLMTAVCTRMREAGHTHAYLTTSSARIPAIKLYAKFGFVPEIRTQEDRETWLELEKGLHPA